MRFDSCPNDWSASHPDGVAEGGAPCTLSNFFFSLQSRDMSHGLESPQVDLAQCMKKGACLNSQPWPEVQST